MIIEDKYCIHECSLCGKLYTHSIVKDFLPIYDRKDYFMDCSVCIMKSEMLS